MKQKQVKTTPKAMKKGKVEKKTSPPKKLMEVVEESNDEEEEIVKKVETKKPGNKKVSKVRKFVEVEETPVDEDASDDEEKVVSKTGNKKATKVKKGKVEKTLEDEENDSEDEQKFVSKKRGNKKATKVQKVEVEQTSEDDEEVSEDEEGAPKNEEEDDQEMDEDQEVEDEDEDEAVEDEDRYDEEHKEEAEEEEEEDEEEDEDGEEEEEDEDDDETEKEQPTIPSKIKGGEIPDSVDPNKIVHITKLPKGCKQVDIVEAFAKYGAIDQIHIITAQHHTDANVAFKTEKAAKAAISGANKKVKINGSLINVYNYKKKEKFDKEQADRTVYVRNFKTDTTKEQFAKHFEDCGEIESIKLIIKPRNPYGFIMFTGKSGAAAAVKLHNSVLNGLNIEVREYTKESPVFEDIFDEKRTVVAKNTQNLDNIDAAKFESIFAKCGEILNLCIVCKATLAFITFKTEEAAQKALQLNGKTEKGFMLDLYLHSPMTKKTSIYVTNLPKSCTEEDLEKCFSRAGEISSINHKGPFAIIRFLNSDGYCKSFLYNESFIKKQMIFVEPLSIRKKVMTAKASKPPNKGFKRPAQNGNSVFKPKKQKVTH